MYDFDPVTVESLNAVADLNSVVDRLQAGMNFLPTKENAAAPTLLTSPSRVRKARVQATGCNRNNAAEEHADLDESFASSSDMGSLPYTPRGQREPRLLEPRVKHFRVSLGADTLEGRSSLPDVS